MSAPDTPLARACAQAEAARRGGRAAEAISHYADALALAPEAPALWNNLALALLGDGRPEDAVAAARMAIAVAPSLAAPHVTLGNALAGLGERAASADAYRAALSQDPLLPAAHYNLGARLFDDHDLAPSRACFARALELAPGHADARFHHALTLALSSELDAAEQELARLEPDNPRVDGLRYARSVATARTRWFADTFVTLGFALDEAHVDGLVLELGVRRGVSIRWLAARLPPHEIHGFDSFEGIPTAWGELPPGTYGVAGELPHVPDSVRIHPGWFEESLPAFLDAHRGPLRLVHFDCDVYASTRVALELLADRLVRGSVLAFDDYLGYRGWRDGEHRALTELVEARGLAVEHVAFSPFTHQAVVRVG